MNLPLRNIHSRFGYLLTQRIAPPASNIDPLTAIHIYYSPFILVLPYLRLSETIIALKTNYDKKRTCVLYIFC